MDKFDNYNNKQLNNIVVHGAGLGRSSHQPLNSLSEFNHHNNHHSSTGALNNNSNTKIQNNNYETDVFAHDASSSCHNLKIDEAVLQGSTDEINLLNAANTNSSQSNLSSSNPNKISYYNNHTLYHGLNGSGNNSPNNGIFGGGQILPRIENSFSANKLGAPSSSKPIRISSAHNLKPIRERNERPMTSFATRVIFFI